jgi:hypothetical protein
MMKLILQMKDPDSAELGSFTQNHPTILTAAGCQPEPRVPRLGCVSTSQLHRLNAQRLGGRQQGAGPQEAGPVGPRGTPSYQSTGNLRLALSLPWFSTRALLLRTCPCVNWIPTREKTWQWVAADSGALGIANWCWPLCDCGQAWADPMAIADECWAHPGSPKSSLRCSAHPCQASPSASCSELSEQMKSFLLRPINHTDR